jgi:hypothetical protein
MKASRRRGTGRREREKKIREAYFPASFFTTLALPSVPAITPAHCVSCARAHCVFLRRSLCLLRVVATVSHLALYAPYSVLFPLFLSFLYPPHPPSPNSPHSYSSIVSLILYHLSHTFVFTLPHSHPLSHSLTPSFRLPLSSPLVQTNIKNERPTPLCVLEWCSDGCC